MPLTIVKRRIRHAGDLLLIGLAPTNQKAVSDNDCSTQRHRRVAAAGVDQATNEIHRSSPGAISIENESEFAVVTVRRRRSRSANTVDAIELAEQHLRWIAGVGKAIVRPRQIL